MLFNDRMPESLKEYGDLNSPSCDNIIKSDCTPTVGFEEHHQKAESDEYHDMYVLEEVVLIESHTEVLHPSTRVDSVPE